MFAGVVNGALGYGFSSLTMPVALMFYTNRVLNPAMVLIELAVNGCTLYMSREGARHVWKRVLPIVGGLIPGVVVGSYALSRVQPGWIRFSTYAALLPLILAQAGGFRRPLRRENAVGVPFGLGIGALYSVTTISGPPLAVLFNNQGLVKQEFKAALGILRVVECVSTAIVYCALGIFSAQSFRLLWAIVPSAAVGIPIGACLIRRVEPETFRRVCMSFDAWVAGFGLSKVLIELKLATSPAAYGVLLAVAVIDAFLLRAFFSARTSGGSGGA